MQYQNTAGETTNNLIEIRDLHFKRGDRVIYKNISMDIPRGKITVIMGPSGTGKTTLLRLIGGQLRPQSGTVIVDGDNIPTLSTDKLFQVRKKMGMLFQSGALFSTLSVFENVAFPLREHTHLSNEIIRNIVLMKLQAVGLRGARDLMPSELSGGMARRVALARAIALDPLMIMYDEPFAGQDPISMGVLVELINQLNKTLGLTSIIVSHDVQEAISIADQIFIIADGTVIAAGSPDEVLKDPTATVQQFMKGLPDGPVPFHYPAPDYEKDLMGELHA